MVLIFRLEEKIEAEEQLGKLFWTDMQHVGSQTIVSISWTVFDKVQKFAQFHHYCNKKEKMVRDVNGQITQGMNRRGHSSRYVRV